MKREQHVNHTRLKILNILLGNVTEKGVYTLLHNKQSNMAASIIAIVKW